MSAQEEPPALPTTWPLARPCPRCSSTNDGALGADRSLRCTESHCGLFIKWVPKRDLGLSTSDKRVGLNLKPSKRSAMFAAFNNACVNCHRDDLPLEVGHLISWAEGRDFGMTETERDDDLNLAPFCDPCNSGQGNESV